MKNIDVLILYEHKNREIESLLVIKNLLENYGLSVRICHLNGTQYYFALLFYIPKVIVVPYFYDENDTPMTKNFESLNSYKVKVINLHQEQIGNKANIDFMLPKGKAKDCFHFVWGEYFRDLLIRLGINESKIFITGSGRLDFFKVPLCNISLNKEKLAKIYKLDAKKKWILFNSNFTKLDDNRICELINLGYKGIREYSRISNESKKLILQWLCEISIRMSNVEVIYRPHPAETISTIPDKPKNLHIIKQLAVRNWTLSSDIIYAWNSTSIIEGFLSNKPAYILRPIELPSEFEVPIIGYLPKIRNLSELTNSIFVEYEKYITLISNELKTQLKKIYGETDGKANQRIANYIYQIVSMDTSNKNPNAIQVNKYCLIKLNKFMKEYGIFAFKTAVFTFLSKIRLLKLFPSYRESNELLLSDLISPIELKILSDKIKYILARYNYK